MNISGKLLRKFIPYRWYKLLANGFIVVPKYYKNAIEELEQCFDLSLEDHINKDLMLMRKFGHIIDKGLHREDAAPGHSKVYYNDLKELVKKVQHTEYANDPTVLWAAEKISKYETLQSHPEQFTPVRQESPISQISFEQLEQLVKERRSNRCFTDKAVTDEVVTQLKDVANWAANSCNKQPIRIFVANEQNLAKECLKCCAGGTGFGNNIPSFWCFTANVRGYVWPSEMYLPSIDTSLGAQNVFLAAQTIGITGTVLTWGQHTPQDDKILRRLLNIPNDYAIIFCAVMGYAEYGYLTPARKKS